MIKGNKFLLVCLGAGGPAISEHDTLDLAIREATRLSAKTDEEYVVYTPSTLIRPKKDVLVEDVPFPKPA